MEDRIIKLLEEQNKKLDILIKNTTISTKRKEEMLDELEDIISSAVSNAMGR